MTSWRYHLLAATPALVLAAATSTAALLVGLSIWFAAETTAALVLGALITIVFWRGNPRVGSVGSHPTAVRSTTADRSAAHR